MKNQPKSWRAVLDKRRKENFIGRAEHLRVFTDNFTRELPDYMIFSVTGEGGVGKSTLLKQFANIAKLPDVNTIVINSDDRHASPVQVMGHIAAELNKAGISHKEFDERYKKYREIREEIESDPNAPRGAIDLLARVGTDFFLKTARKLPGAAPLLDSVDEKATSETISQLIQYGITKWTNKDERSLLLETDRIMTPLFLDLLGTVSDKRRLVLMLDVFERTSQSLSRWLLQLFNFEYGDFDTNLTFVIAGRDSLEQHWTELAGSICHIALEPFTPDETRLYLANQGITDDSLAMQIHEDTGGLPVLVELLTATKPQPGVPLADVSKDAVERFLQWIPQEDRRRIALVSAVLRQFNRDILTAVIGDEATNAFGWISMQSFVRVDSERGWFYHEKVRELMLRHLRNTTPKELDEAHNQLSNCWKVRGTFSMSECCRSGLKLKGLWHFQKCPELSNSYLAEYFVKEQTDLNLEGKAAYENEVWRKAECERVYHLLSTQPELNKYEAVNAFLHAFRFRKKFSASIARATKQVGREKSVKLLTDLAHVLSDLYSAYDADEYYVGIDKLNVLEQENSLTAIAKSTIFARRGYLYSEAGNYEQALANLNCAIELDQQYFLAICSRGMVYGLMSKYEEALMEFNRAIELNAKSIGAVAGRGLTYQLMERYEDALKDFSQVIKMDEKSADALVNRATIYQTMNRHEEALADLDRAVELDEKMKSSRGLFYLQMGKYEEALADINRVVELHEEPAEIIANRGVIYGMMGRYDEALKDFNHAIELNETSVGAIANRGLTYRLMGRYEEALVDIRRVIELDGESSGALAKRGTTLGMMGRYEESLADFNRAIELDGKSADIVINRGITYRWMERYEDALADFNWAIKEDDKSIDALLNRGATNRQMERYEEAITDFNRAIQVDKKCAQAFAGLGLAYRQMGRYKHALKEFSRAIEIDNKYIMAIVSRGETYRLMDRDEKAILDFDRAIKLDEKDAYVFARRGASLRQMARHKEALADLDRAIELEEKYVWAITSRGRTYTDMGRFEEALAELNKAIRLDGNFVQAFIDRGVTYRLMGRFEEALVDFDNAIKLNNGSKDDKDGRDTAIAWRGEMNRRLGRYEEAISDFSRAIKNEPKDNFSLSRRAAVYLVTGKTKAAQRDFSQIIARSPKSVQDYYNRGIAFVLFQRNSDAIKVLKEAFRLDSVAYFYAVTDDLLDPIRNLPEIQSLIDRARPQ